MIRSGLLKDLKKRRFYEKPSEAKKRKAAAPDGVAPAPAGTHTRANHNFSGKFAARPPIGPGAFFGLPGESHPASLACKRGMTPAPAPLCQRALTPWVCPLNSRLSLALHNGEC